MPKEKISQSSDEDENEAVEDTGDVGEVDELAGDMGDYIPELPTQVGQLLDIDNLPEKLPDLRDVPVESHLHRLDFRRYTTSGFA